MENASKALIIAGAILVSILLISIGVLIINSTNNMQEEVKDSSDSMAKQTFNSKFTIYEGSGNSPAQIKQLVNAVQTTKGTSHVVTHTFSGNLSSIADVVNNKTYNVSLGYDNNGYVNTVTISD